MDWYVANPDLSEDGVMAFYWVETWSSTKIASHLPVIRNLVVLCCQKEVMMNAQISSLGGETILALGVSKQMSWTRQLPDTFIPQVYLHVCWYRIPICCWSMFITKGSSRGATLSFTLRSKGEGGQPRYLILQEIASHFSNPPPPHPPPPHLPRTLRADSKHCNLQYFCSFRIKKPHFATWWNLRKYQCFC